MNAIPLVPIRPVADGEYYLIFCPETLLRRQGARYAASEAPAGLYEVEAVEVCKELHHFNYPTPFLIGYGRKCLKPWTRDPTDTMYLNNEKQSTYEDFHLCVARAYEFVESLAVKFEKAPNPMLVQLSNVCKTALKGPPLAMSAG